MQAGSHQAGWAWKGGVSLGVMGMGGAGGSSGVTGIRGCHQELSRRWPTPTPTCTLPPPWCTPTRRPRTHLQVCAGPLAWNDQRAP